MSVEDRNKEPQTDLSLPLHYHNRSIRLRKNIGAGVNATSKVDSTLVTSHPLVELVWSPRKGISVKSTDRTLTDKQSAILWGMGSSTLAVSSTKSASAKRSSSDNFKDEKNDIISTSHVNFDVDKVDPPGRATRSDMMGGLNQGHNEDTEDKSCEVHTQTAYKGREKVNFGTSLDVGPVTGENQLPGLSPYGEVGYGNALSVIPGNAGGIAISSQEGPSRKHNVSTAFVGQEDRSMLKIAGAITENIDRLEFGAENYLLAEASKRANLVNFNDHNSSCRELEGVHPLDASVHGKCLMNPRMEEYLRKGKAKALSCGNVNDQLVDDNDSHGSAGSCNKMSATSGKTKRGLDQQLIVTSKRLKQGSISDADSASFIRQSSSFMSWITNMIKGYPGYNPDNSPSSMLAGMLTTHAEHESHSQKPIASGQELRGVGFRKLFKSICCSNDSVEGRKVYVDYQNKEGSGDAKNSSVVDVNAVPLAAYRTGDNAHEHICRLNKMCDQPKSGKDIVNPSKQGTILSLIPRMETDSYKVANETQIVKSRSYNSSVDKERAHTSEYNDSDNTLGEKAAQGIGHKQDYLGSVWITRFRPRITEPASNKHLTSMSINNRVLPNSEDKGSSVKCLMNVVHEEQSTTLFSEGRNGFSKNEDLVGSESEQMKGKDEHNLEVMASVFARRLDALKQVVPFGNTCKPAPTTDTCFFCGGTGHDIQYCSEITGSELEDLSHKVKSVDQATDAPPPCVCINCFQLSHWAIECPQRSSRKSTLGSEKEGRSLIKRNYISVGTLGPHRMSRGNLEPGTEFIQLQGCSSKLDHEHDIIEAKNPLDMGYGGQEAGESSSPLLSTAMLGKLSVGMEGVFDAIRRLRLSRSDFLRSMDSQIPPSYLIGFYLRVRLSNCKEGVGGKGYYVACIQGSPDGAGSKTSVTVTIGGFTGLVESRYISNQDFLEDELVTWWTTTAKPGHSKNPSLEELEQKYEERTKLGF